MDKGQAINIFWNSFGLKAYDVYSVPHDAVMPYITYNHISDELDHPVSMDASIWYRDTSWTAITDKAKAVADRLMYGVTMKLDEGYVWIVKGHPFQQRMNDPNDDMIKRIYINVQVEYLSH